MSDNQLCDIIEKYTEDLIKLYNIKDKCAADVFNSAQLDYFNKQTVRYIIVGLSYYSQLRQLTRTQKSFLPINMVPSEDGRIKKIQNIILKKILQEIFDVQDNLIIILQSDRFLYICQAASIESFKSCKIIKLNNNCNDINEIARRINFAEQQLAYDKSYDFDKQEFIQIWQQENKDEDEDKNKNEDECEDVQVEQIESEKNTKTQQNKQKVKRIKKIIKKEKQ